FLEVHRVRRTERWMQGGRLSMFAQNAVVWALGVTALLSLLVILLGVRFIPNDRIGVVEKRWSLKGSLKSGFVPMVGEPAFQPAVLRGGLPFPTPFQYAVHKMPLVTIPQGKIGYVFARDGHALAATQTLAGTVQSTNYQDVEQFLASGGQRGPQRAILRE